MSASSTVVPVVASVIVDVPSEKIEATAMTMYPRLPTPSSSDRGRPRSRRSAPQRFEVSVEKSSFVRFGGGDLVVGLALRDPELEKHRASWGQSARKVDRVSDAPRRAVPIDLRHTRLGMALEARIHG